MLKTNFYPSDYRNDNILLATYVYMFIWENYGKRIIKVSEKVSVLKFDSGETEALVSNERSKSSSLTLSSYYKSSGKRVILVHELLHQLLHSNGIAAFKIGENRTEIHKVLYLILYDILNGVYGEKLANWAENFETKGLDSESYKKAWEWALPFSKEGRRAKFQEFVKKAQAESK